MSSLQPDKPTVCRTCRWWRAADPATDERAVCQQYNEPTKPRPKCSRWRASDGKDGDK